ncbi:Bifunctional protein FolD protein [Firmicutes bacterium ASF500]|nr:Bifunctional protein FolD protein [Firmicutes bacterium ASF500]
MAAIVMDGKSLAAKIREQVRLQVEQMERKPGMAMVLVGENPAAQVYEAGKRKDCQQCGIYYETYRLPEDVPQGELLDVIHFLNEREGIDGILVQFPLPEHLDDREIQLAIRPDKDVDCVHPSNVGDLTLGVDCFWPCTPAGVMRLLAEYGVDPAYKNCTMVGRSNIVGKPQAMLLLRRDCTVTVCHTKTPDLAAECRRADILISAAGHPGLIAADMVKEGAVVIDVAVNRDGQGRLCGDVDYEAVREKASYITPVPGGVGPVTRAVLMENTLTAALRHGK